MKADGDAGRSLTEKGNKMSHDEICNGWTELANDALAEESADDDDEDEESE